MTRRILLALALVLPGALPVGAQEAPATQPPLVLSPATPPAAPAMTQTPAPEQGALPTEAPAAPAAITPASRSNCAHSKQVTS